MPHDFDTAALTYDTVFTHSLIGQAQRNRVHRYLMQELSSATRLNILELNCGTGADARFLAEKGHQVLATDVSEGMIGQAQNDVPDGVIFKPLDINKLENTDFGQTFDFIFSNFGGLNCLNPDQLAQFMTTAPTVLNEGGRMILVLMPKNCLWEQLYFRWKGNLRAAKRRNTNQAVQADVDGVQVATWYYNPKDIARLVGNRFRITRFRPIGLSIPPSYMELVFKKSPFLLRILQRIEPLFNYRFWARYADHFIISLEKS